ncbi:MAG: sigma-54-dependent Fis family transcriptional regulator [Calditrichaeota bacterium]|nr:sigma-54-dependent Fis family transcriptional regulator [Calditrichota bacterium]
MEKGKRNNNDGKILVIDDQLTVLESIVNLLKSSHYSCLTAHNKAEGLKVFKEKKPLVVLTDLKMETPLAGIEFLQEARQIDPDAVILLYTAYGTVPVAVEAFKKGAFDFIQKVQISHDILLPIERAFKYARMQQENEYLRGKVNIADDGGFYGAVGTSPPICDVFEKAKRVARTITNVFITGETGTGKDVIARGIHYYSQRKDESFVPVLVSALPEHLLERELFGHVKGTFTGANADKQGLFEAADRGTIFLDEIAEVSLEMQHKLLRVLNDRRVRRLGSVKEREVDVRIISATNKDPEEMVKSGMMREDLYFRLNVIRLHVPPLRERKEDIPVLAYHFLKKSNSRGLIKIDKFSNETLLILQQYPWPGNVRELESVIEHIIALSNSPIVRPEDLPERLRPTSKRVFVDTNAELDFKTSKERLLQTWEKQYIETLLEKYDNNVTKVADAAGLNRKTIYRLIDNRGIEFRKMKIDN